MFLNLSENMSALGQFNDVTHSYPMPQKPKKSVFRKYFGSPFDLPKLSSTWELYIKDSFQRNKTLFLVSLWDNYLNSTYKIHLYITC